MEMSGATGKRVWDGGLCGSGWPGASGASPLGRTRRTRPPRSGSGVVSGGPHQWCGRRGRAAPGLPWPRRVWESFQAEGLAAWVRGRRAPRRRGHSSSEVLRGGRGPAPLIPAAYGGQDSPLLTQEGDGGPGLDWAPPEAPRSCTRASISAWEIGTIGEDGNASPWKKGALPGKWCWSRGPPSAEGRQAPLTPIRRDSKRTRAERRASSCTTLRRKQDQIFGTYVRQ